jgi:hypothetical protein
MAVDSAEIICPVQSKFAFKEITLANQEKIDNYAIKRN